jgi:hypothetical protein
MRIEREQVLLSRGSASQDSSVLAALAEIRNGIAAVVWPRRSKSFAIRPVRQGNGVTPIKARCMAHLKASGWELERRMALAQGAGPGPIDAVKKLDSGRLFAVEWETGNISSSHRALNKLLVGLQERVLDGGALILPTRALYKYLTDRVGNYEELEPYFSVWDRPDVQGVLLVIAVQHDELRNNVPRIRKGTDGRALG